MRKPIIAANWKMYKTQKEAVDFLESLAASSLKEDREVWIAPPFTAISALSSTEKKAKISLKIGAQTISEHTEGAFTGEISARMAVEAGAQFVIIGHSERRQIFHETNAQIRKKTEKALEQSLIPMLCVGETEGERSLGQTNSVLKKQLEEALHGFSSPSIQSLVIAYEPVWAIGTGKVATPELANEAHHYVRKVLADLFGLEVAKEIRILYGGSVKPEFIKDLMDERDIDGALVGGASLNPDSFLKIINY